MSRRPATYPYAPAAPDLSAIFEAVAEAAAQAETYARAATDFAAIGDARGLSYSLRCASAALVAAADLADELRPSRQGGERAA